MTAAQLALEGIHVGRNLLQEYADLTRQLMEVTRKRTEVGKLLEREQTDARLAAKRAEDKRIAEAIISVAETGSWDAAVQALGMPDWRLDMLFHNVLRHIRRRYPAHADVIPTKVSPRTMETWNEWGPFVRKYLKTLR